MNFKVILLLLISLPNILFGQGFVLLKSESLDSFNYYDVDDIQPIYHQNRNLIALSSDSLHIIDIRNGKQRKTTFKNSDMQVYMDAIQVVDSSYFYFNSKNDNFIFLKNNKLSKQKKIKLDKKNPLIINYSFQDSHFLYLIAFYNKKPQTILGHDVVRFFKISKKRKKVVLRKEINIGKEIIFSPLNYQQIAFNGSQFTIASSVKNELYIIDKTFNLIDTLVVDQDLKNRNNLVLDNVFPDSLVNYYLYKVKQLIYDYRNSEVSKLKILNKVLYLNKTTLLLAYTLSYRKKHLLAIYDILTQKIIRTIDVKFSGDKLSNFCWTRRAYANNEDEILLIQSEKQNDSIVRFQANIYEYSNNPIVNKSLLSNSNLFNHKNNTIDITIYSGVILADDYLCKGCYSNYGIGEGVLVIKKIPKDISDLKHYYYSTKRNWGINGNLVFVDEENYNTLYQSLKLNMLYPLTE